MSRVNCPSPKGSQISPFKYSESAMLCIKWTGPISPVWLPFPVSPSAFLNWHIKILLKFKFSSKLDSYTIYRHIISWDLLPKISILLYSSHLTSFSKTTILKYFSCLFLLFTSICLNNMLLFLTSWIFRLRFLLIYRRWEIWRKAAYYGE